jgi:hypothetical protein
VAKLGPKTVDELKQVLCQAWSSIFQATTRKLYRSLEARLRICLDLMERQLASTFGSVVTNQHSPHGNWNS